MSQTTQLLFKNRVPGKTVFFKDFCANGGYQGLKTAIQTMSPLEIRDLVKAAALRGRGGAGFPTGVKWGFFPADKPGIKYLVCNCDEMEPGTYKDGVLLGADPHQLVEGMILSAFALQTQVGYIFIRYAYEKQAENLRRAIAEATQAGYLGKNILGSGFDFELHVHGSAGRYILGEETALLNGLEGIRPNPRLKPPFPAVRGLFGQPTTVNNVETIANIPHIVTGGAQWFKDLALTPDGSGTKLFGLSGHLNRTECFELPVGISLREVIETYGQGMWKNKQFKACLPGGASTPFLTREHLDVALDFASLEKIGSRFGTAGVTAFDDDTCMVAVTLNLIRFFARESCGWCTPCRDGLTMVRWILEMLESGQGTPEHLEMLKDQLKNISGKSFCALAEGAMGPVAGLLTHFEQEIVDHIKGGRCPFSK
ncbi:NADH-quinone oxidoreductase subunit NuoF [Pelovirga terrestris]|uniref:NADH-quinone oxidoreductase subunit NuoF n=1 Tax=Pelovirga terrestris TaxID=2771352 RepID=A0A8J6QX71_9BACT|nr:NADH-quinone oxidoreductase subunit NuoF [Pelovirga terrestris]MBD1400566.1 NADH-quinone oxidoreductase subunit NuoF [Pelovirga terrestris]